MAELKVDVESFSQRLKRLYAIWEVIEAEITRDVPFSCTRMVANCLQRLMLQNLASL